MRSNVLICERIRSCCCDAGASTWYASHQDFCLILGQANVCDCSPLVPGNNPAKRGRAAPACRDSQNRVQLMPAARSCWGWQVSFDLFNFLGGSLTGAAGGSLLALRLAKSLRADRHGSAAHHSRARAGDIVGQDHQLIDVTSTEPYCAQVGNIGRRSLPTSVLVDDSLRCIVRSYALLPAY